MLEMFKLQRKANLGRASFLFALFVWLTMSQGSVAQAAQKHHIGLDAGFASYQSRDLLVSPLMYSGGQRALALSYLYKGVKNRHYLRISYGSGQLESSVGNLIDNLRGSLQYSYQRYLAAPLNENTKLFAGFFWNSFVSARESTIKVTEQFQVSDIYSGELISALHFSIFGEYNADGKNEMAFQATFPVLTYALRPGYTLGPPDGLETSVSSFWDVIKAGDVATVNEYIQLDTTISYNRFLSNRLNIGLAYQFIFYQFSKPRKTATVENGIHIGVILKL